MTPFLSQPVPSTGINYQRTEILAVFRFRRARCHGNQLAPPRRRAAGLSGAHIPDGEVTAVVYRLICDSPYTEAVQLLGGGGMEYVVMTDNGIYLKNGPVIYIWSSTCIYRWQLLHMLHIELCTLKIITTNILLEESFYLIE